MIDTRGLRARLGDINGAGTAATGVDIAAADADAYAEAGGGDPAGMDTEGLWRNCTLRAGPALFSPPDEGGELPGALPAVEGG